MGVDWGEVAHKASVDRHLLIVIVFYAAKRRIEVCAVHMRRSDLLVVLAK